MGRDHRTRGPARRRRPGVEGLEPRGLLSHLPGPGPAPRHHPFNLPAPTIAAAAAGVQATAVPHELARSQVTAYYTGNYIVGPPQTTDQLSQTVIFAKQKVTWVAHHDAFMAITFTTPQQPGTLPTLQATIHGPGRTTPSGTLVLDLNYPTNAPSPQERVLPTLLTFTVNTQASSGDFAGATGAGLLQITYGPTTRAAAANPGALVPGGLSRGFAAVAYSGLIFTNQQYKLFHP